VRRVADGRDRGERRILLHLLHDRERADPFVVEIEDHQRRGVLAHRLDRAVHGSREAQIDAELVRRRLDLRAEHEVVEYG